MKFDSLPDREKDWVEDYLNGSISPDEFEAFEQRLMDCAEFRGVLRRCLSVQNHLETSESISWLDTMTLSEEVTASENRFSSRQWAVLGIAASIAFFLGAILMSWRTETSSHSLMGNRSDSDEPRASGYAVVGQIEGIIWPRGKPTYHTSEILDAGLFELDSGRVEITFFSGATMVVEGPAKIELRSAWEAKCYEGAVRMRVPPAARGFVLHGPSSKIVDLGTEFGLNVRDGNAEVEVFDGEISLRHRDEAEKLLEVGHAFRLPFEGSSQEGVPGKYTFPKVLDSPPHMTALTQDFERWQSYRDRTRKDERLIAFYTFDEDMNKQLVRDLKNGYDGSPVIAERVAGRWPGLNDAMDFRKLGSRVRVNIPGEFSAYSFVCWVRIDSLDRWYNALFMGDGYETGEPHWQIRDDGKLMLSVMVDDSRPNPNSPRDAGFHRVYFSPSFWDISMSGQWLHLCSVFDPIKREVSHFVNGEKLSSQEIIEDFYIDKLRIGNGEIGSWGQPFRKSPGFAIRNLNGRIDEIALYDAALTDIEVAELYESSRAAFQ